MTDSKAPSGAVSFKFDERVYWDHTDAGGVVYHASYLCFLEHARTEWLRAMGIDQRTLRERDDLVLAVRAMQLDFLSPARLDDALQVTVVLNERRHASFTVSQEVMRGDDCLLRAQVRVACLTAGSFRPRSLPDWLIPDLISAKQR